MGSRSAEATRRPGTALDRLANVAVEGAFQIAGETGNPQAAELIICGQVCTLLESKLSSDAWRWVEQQLDPAVARWFLSAAAIDKELCDAATELRQSWRAHIDPLATFYERFLYALDAKRRKRQGVFFTPSEVVRFIVRAIDDLLTHEFGLSHGIADASYQPAVRIFDPALGAGLFLTEIIRFCHARHRSAFAADTLLPRLGGMELLPAAAAIAVVRIAAALAETGYSFTAPAQLDIRIGDALAQPIRPPWTVIVGNPPFSGISTARHEWLQKLLRGKSPEGIDVASYYRFGGQPLGERKHWLQDDYVKFLRAAQDQIDTAGAGIVALVTNHGFLENTTFRGVRESLEQRFHG